MVYASFIKASLILFIAFAVIALICLAHTVLGFYLYFRTQESEPNLMGQLRTRLKYSSAMIAVAVLGIILTYNLCD